MRFLECADEDLQYLGSDRELARAFSAGDRQQEWPVVAAGPGVYQQAEDAVHQALAMLGATGKPPTAASTSPSPIGGSLLAQFAVNFTALLRADSAPRTVGREEMGEHPATSLLSFSAACL